MLSNTCRAMSTIMPGKMTSNLTIFLSRVAGFFNLEHICDSSADAFGYFLVFWVPKPSAWPIPTRLVRHQISQSKAQEERNITIHDYNRTLYTYQTPRKGVTDHWQPFQTRVASTALPAGTNQWNKFQCSSATLNSSI